MFPEAELTVWSGGGEAGPGAMWMQGLLLSRAPSSFADRRLQAAHLVLCGAEKGGKGAWSCNFSSLLP